MTKMMLECGKKTLANNEGRSSILVVDDEPDISAIIKRSAHRDGFEVTTFADALKALEYLKENCKTYSLILSDIRMPGMNGYEFVKKVKEIDNDVKVAFMSAFEIEDRELHHMLPGIKVDAFLQKPFSFAKVSEVVNKTTTIS